MLFDLSCTGKSIYVYSVRTLEKLATLSGLVSLELGLHFQAMAFGFRVCSLLDPWQSGHIRELQVLKGLALLQKLIGVEWCAFGVMTALSIAT